jgi:hypothetical protein
MSKARHIEVWHDDTSDPDEPLWCVSLCEEDGEEVRCFSTHDERNEADAAARRAAQKRGLKAYYRGKHGDTVAL